MILVRWLALSRFSYLDLVWLIWSWSLWFVSKMYWQSILVLVCGALVVSAIEVGIGMFRSRNKA